jgi:transposase InsO family protein
LIEEAVASGARRWKACEVIGISLRTYQRWCKDLDKGDGRHGERKQPANSLSAQEVAAIIAVATSKRFRELPPSQIVPILAEEGLYVGSESSFYRILRREKLLEHREPSRPRQHSRPKEHVAIGPNQVWSWDITYLRSAVRGRFYYLYLTMDVWSRMIVGWRVEETESDQIATQMIGEACLRHGVEPNQLVLHSDNGGPMKGATLLATLQFLGVVPSFSRPHVSDDNAYSEALFRTLKYRPEYAGAVFASPEHARGWVEAFVQWYNTEICHSHYTHKNWKIAVHCFSRLPPLVSDNRGGVSVQRRRVPNPLGKVRSCLRRSNSIVSA